MTALRAFGVILILLYVATPVWAWSHPAAISPPRTKSEPVAPSGLCGYLHADGTVTLSDMACLPWGGVERLRQVACDEDRACSTSQIIAEERAIRGG